MRRTDFPQGMPGQFGVASFVWDATEDGPIPLNGTYMRGEIPSGSILIGGFVHVSKVLTGTGVVDFHLGGIVPVTPGVYLGAVTSATPVGFAVLIKGQLVDPTKNSVVTTASDSRIMMYTTVTPVTTGQFALYLFYVNNDLGEFGQATTPTLYKRSKSPVALPSEIKVASFVWDAATDGALLAGGSLLRGEIPNGSVLIGGFLHITTVLAAAVNLKLDDQVLLAASATAVGQYALTLGQFADPTKNVLISTEARSSLTATGAIATGQFSVYLFYVTNQVGVYGNLGERRRTESPEARPGEMRLATWTWDAAADGPLSAGGTALNGEIPPGSILVGGFVHVATILGASVSFKLDNQVLLAAAAAAGWYELTLGKFDDPTANVLINTTVRSRLTVTGAATTGRFVLYLFYINNELGLHGQITAPHSSQIT